ncbi:copper resistance system multicopper oxidase [Lichenibacterium dinghuense]|uniref:copper resistance system multicopper oxidase n=1 Tax=Lichenibacterium dinghuense TaxID=2895977 RepID=UPI001F027495|nr:copper resistance system multicopper oxidase [Lichenibacterium sp. 6Y81]
MAHRSAPPRPALTRRRFVAGLGAAAASSLLGLRQARAAFALKSPGEAIVPVTSSYDLVVARGTANKTGTETWANTINGGTPGPTLRWREGDVVTLNVRNDMPEVTGLHWHGIILPNDMDGVPGLEFAGIAPGETYQYRFPVLQSGTYWYHSHMGYQEQKGVYGALVIDPVGRDFVQADRDYVVLLSDWTDEDPKDIQNKTKYQSDYYNFGKRTVTSFFADVERSGLEPVLKERFHENESRMDPSGLEAPSGETYTYLINGQPPSANWTALFRPGERVRLRFINASAATYYDVRIPGLAMSVVNVHGNDVVPVAVDQFRIGVAETYDVVVRPTQDRAFTIYAEDLGRSGYARGTLAPRDGMEAEIPVHDPRPLRTMTDMGMQGMMGKDQIGASHPNGSRIGGIMGEHAADVIGKKNLGKLAGHQPMAKPPEGVELDEPGVEVQMKPKMLTERMRTPGDGLNFLPRRELSFSDLRSILPAVDDRPPTRTITLKLSGNMQRMIWGFDGKKYTEVGPIDVTVGERFRLVMINETMMTHPIHLHGMWMELENGQGRHRPYLHTLSVQPAEKLSVLITPVATGQWPLHCHILYHFEAGMFRTLRVLPRDA